MKAAKKAREMDFEELHRECQRVVREVIAKNRETILKRWEKNKAHFKKMREGGASTFSEADEDLLLISTVGAWIITRGTKSQKIIFETWCERVHPKRNP